MSVRDGPVIQISGNAIIKRNVFLYEMSVMNVNTAAMIQMRLPLSVRIGPVMEGI